MRFCILLYDWLSLQLSIVNKYTEKRLQDEKQNEKLGVVAFIIYIIFM